MWGLELIGGSQPERHEKSKSLAEWISLHKRTGCAVQLQTARLRSSGDKRQLQKGLKAQDALSLAAGLRLRFNMHH